MPEIAQQERDFFFFPQEPKCMGSKLFSHCVWNKVLQNKYLLNKLPFELGKVADFI